MPASFLASSMWEFVIALVELVVPVAMEASAGLKGRSEGVRIAILLAPEN